MFQGLTSENKTSKISPGKTKKAKGKKLKDTSSTKKKEEKDESINEVQTEKHIEIKNDTAEGKEEKEKSVLLSRFL